jgi:hypothetical protein
LSEFIRFLSEFIRFLSEFIRFLSEFIRFLSEFILGKPCYIRLPDPSKKEKRLKKKKHTGTFSKTVVFIPFLSEFMFSSLRYRFGVCFSLIFLNTRKTVTEIQKNIGLEAHRKLCKVVLGVFWYGCTT